MSFERPGTSNGRQLPAGLERADDVLATPSTVMSLRTSHASDDHRRSQDLRPVLAQRLQGTSGNGPLPSATRGRDRRDAPTHEARRCRRGCSHHSEPGVT